MAAWEDYPTLQGWYLSLTPLRVDIIGDFASKELFGIHGDSLLMHCISKAMVDYKGKYKVLSRVEVRHGQPDSAHDGFQLLHAVHAVEAFLTNLKQRGCVFHVIWFQNHEQLSIPTNASNTASACTRLTRAILIRHLQHLPLGSEVSFDFPAVESVNFQEHLSRHSFRFFLCLDGFAFDGRLSPLAIQHLAFIHKIASRGYSIALFNNFEFTSSKAFASVVPPCLGAETLYIEEPVRYPRKRIVSTQQFERDAGILDQNWTPWHDFEPLTAKDKVSLACLCNMLSRNSDHSMKTCAAAYVLHLAELRRCSLSRRPCTIAILSTQEQRSVDEFLAGFAEFCMSIVEELPIQEQWDVFDLLDGRIFRQIFKNLRGLVLAPDVAADVNNFAKRIYRLTQIDISQMLPTNPPKDSVISHALPSTVAESRLSSVMFFKHDILDRYLVTTNVIGNASTKSMRKFKVSQELTHWHNANVPLDPKCPPRKKGFFARQKHQNLMADIIAYSASLTSASGNVINPETIVTLPVADTALPSLLANQQPSGNGSSKTKCRERRSKSEYGFRHTGRERARKTQDKLHKEKSDNNAQAVMVSWDRRCREILNEERLAERFFKARKYLASLSRDGLRIVGAEVLLFMCDIVALMVLEGKKDGNNSLELAYFARIYSCMLEAAAMPQSGESLTLLRRFSKTLQIPVSATGSGEPVLNDRKLPFSSAMAARGPELKLPHPPIEFQLKHCGPFLERSFGAAPDSRVPYFEPDAWQRKVLDAIDANKSLFVVAPTSAGKTFITFYAMKKVLQSSDDHILVYVAPTKALVNQVAAEIQARFSKSYRHDGRSVWAVHTRDYRIHSPTGCQILVTVPHILQIMLLAPSNAMNANAWSGRLRTIIFDEVHCIGQADDGVIWEQLLLLAPCPIIALSATVGNPLEFKQWLEISQTVKGHDLEIIIHSSRYSDLRKYLYISPKNDFLFRGLRATEALVPPGLDEAPRNPIAFSFIHPIGSLTNRNRQSIDDIALEPRDYLNLWRCMVKHQNKDHPVADALHPEQAMPAIVKRSDVLRWGKDLKRAFEAWMKDAESPFSVVQNELGRPILQLNSEPRREADQAEVDCFVFTTHVSDKTLCSKALPLLTDLHDRGALPAILFNYDRGYCEKTLHCLLEQLTNAENAWKKSSSQWKRKLSDYERWQKAKTERKIKKAEGQNFTKSRSQDEPKFSKLDMMREASVERSKWEDFDADAPLDLFSFADRTKLPMSELEAFIDALRRVEVNPLFLLALRRGIAVHHAGLNRQYRQIVEILFRKGYLRVVIATGTLALGINMPCKTVVFFGDSVFLTSLNFHQASGRAGRRGFDLLGNVVFVGIPPKRVLEIVSSTLPDMRGHFPLSTTLTLRLLGLLHHSNNSKYAVKAVQSILSQSRLYMGGPSNQMAIQHHLRFSIEYLQRQHLLSNNGAPLNFAGLVGHLYFTENAVFAFHTLLKEGYFHKVCEAIDHKPKDVLHSLVLVLAHLFCRIPLRVKDHVMEDGFRSPSVIQLPSLPETAASILRSHNQETLNIFRLYVSTFVDQHLTGTPDVQLPFTRFVIQPVQQNTESHLILDHLPPTKLRSPFSALSGFTDEFRTIHELCATVRSGVFLEEAAVPYIRIYPADTDTPWNAYIYDFFKHGDMTALVRDNLIKRGDVWFHLKDFSLILATIVASLENVIGHNGHIDDSPIICTDDMDHTSSHEWKPTPTTVEGKTSKLADTSETGKKEPVLDSWEDDVSDSESCSAHSQASDQSSQDGNDKDLLQVLQVFRLLRDEFDEKFRKEWA